MRKTRSAEMVKTRYRSPKKSITAFDQKLQQKKFVAPLAPLDSAFPVNYPINDPAGTSGQDPAYAVPSTIVYFYPGMTVDDVGAGQTVEEELTRYGTNYKTSVRLDFFRNVWFDGLEAYPYSHYTVSGDYLLPYATLDVDTEVIGRYVVK